MSHQILQYFTHDHLQSGLTQDVTRASGDLARYAAESLPSCAETSAGLRKLLEAKDCFVRAALPSSDRREG